MESCVSRSVPEGRPCVRGRATRKPCWVLWLLVVAVHGAVGCSSDEDLPDYALGVVGTYEGRATVAATNPLDGGVLGADLGDAVEIGYRAPNRVSFEPAWLPGCSSVPVFVESMPDATTFRSLAGFWPVSCDVRVLPWAELGDDCGGATMAWQSGSGAMDAGVLTIQLDGVIALPRRENPTCAGGDWPYRFTFTGSRTNAP